MARGWLTAAGLLDLAAALLHLGCIAGGAAWYRAVGAGEPMARRVERGELAPHLATLGIALVLAAWAAYAFSAAGLLPRLPLLRPALVAIAAVYTLRALAPLVPQALPGRSQAFLLQSSAIVALFALVHIVATALAWRRLGG